MTLSGTTVKTTFAMEPKNSRKSPPYPKKMTSVKKMTPTKIKASRFTLGATRTNTMEIVKPGCVKEAKMKLEERIRKEKREKKLAEIRKPLLATPKGKRVGQDEGEWQTDRQHQEAKQKVSASSALPKLNGNGRCGTRSCDQRLSNPANPSTDARS